MRAVNLNAGGALSVRTWSAIQKGALYALYNHWCERKQDGIFASYCRLYQLPRDVKENHRMMQLALSVAIAFLGLIIGSFLNVVIHRGPGMWKLTEDASRRGNLAVPRSYCPACGAPIRAAQLIPVVSYLTLGGRCASCKAPIPVRYLFVELSGAIAALTAYWLFGLTAAAFAAAVFFWILIALATIDLETGYLPDSLTLPLIFIGLLANAAGLFTTPVTAAIGAGAGYLSFRLIGEAFLRLRGKEGLGQGDAKLLAALGAWLGWPALAPAVLLAALLALGGAFAMRLAGEEITGATPIPFGPALAVAGALIFTLGAILPGESYFDAFLAIFP